MTALRATALATLLYASGCLSPVVGAECAAGLEVCDGTCVDLEQDPMHCGACGQVCEGECRLGVCTFDGDPDDDVSVGPDGDPDDDPVLGCDLGELRCADGCADPRTDGENCGACGVVCDGVCSEGTCVPSCEAPSTLCGDVCVNTDDHPDHCGGCGRACASGLCEAGVCESAAAGHVVVVGHDYRQSRSGMNRLVGNAVFLTGSSPASVVSWVGDAHPAAVAGARKAIDQVAGETGRTWTETEAHSASYVPSQLADADVFLVYAQSGAGDAGLAELGQEWQVALQSFTTAAGVVVVLDGAGDHSGTFQVLEPSGLFAAGSRAEVTGETLSVVDPADSVAVSVPLSYFAERRSFAFVPDAGDVVVEAQDGAVVVHRAIY